MASEDVFEDCHSSEDELYEDCPAGAEPTESATGSDPAQPDPAAPESSPPAPEPARPEVGDVRPLSCGQRGSSTRGEEPGPRGRLAAPAQGVGEAGGVTQPAAEEDGAAGDGAAGDGVTSPAAGRDDVSAGGGDAPGRPPPADWDVLDEGPAARGSRSSDEVDVSGGEQPACAGWDVLEPAAAAVASADGKDVTLAAPVGADDAALAAALAEAAGAEPPPAAARRRDSDDDGELLADPDAVDDEALRRLDESQSEAEREARRAEAAELKAEGNRLVAEAAYDAARERYTAALRVCPLTAVRERAVLFSNRAACRARAADEAGAIADCGRALELDAEYARPLQRRAELLERAEKLDEALEDWRRLLALQPGHAEARRAAARLPGQIAERNERLKDEMLGKLKDLGNMLLRPFNLSTDNFQMEQNEAGGYSVKFKPA